MEKLNASVLIPVAHVEQQLAWDCGVSCVAMLLSQKQREYLINSKAKIAREEGFGTSTWTIDLCYLLKRFGIDHTYRTVTLGVNPSVKDSVYYKRTLPNDMHRVEDRFRCSSARGVVVECKPVTLSEMLGHLSDGNPVVVLVDGNLLHCDECLTSKIVSKVRSVMNFSVPYQGHYVVVCGYSISHKKIFYRNPAKSDRLCTISFDAFEKARKQFGTDEDVVLIQQYKSSVQTPSHEGARTCRQQLLGI